MPYEKPLWWAHGALMLAVLGTGCGGSGNEPLPPPALRAAAPGSAAAVSASAPTPTPTQLLDWAENHVGNLFPSRRADAFLSPYTYRYYPETGNYAGVANGRVYLLGPAAGSDSVPLDVGALEDFTCLVIGSPCAEPELRITLPPVDVALTAPSTATFTVTALGQTVTGYQWQRSTDGGRSFADIAGATARSYTTPPTSASDNDQRLRVLVRSQHRSWVSAAATLAVRAQAGEAVVALAAGANHACALLASGGAACWGSNTYGQLGDGTTVQRTAPVPVTGLSGAVALSLGYFHSCALLDSGGVSCWGSNRGGELGLSDLRDRRVPTPVPGLAGIARIVADMGGGCAVAASGAVACWGSPMGNGGLAGSSGPVDLPALRGLRGSVTGNGALRRCALGPTGQPSCWGAFPDARLYVNPTAIGPASDDHVQIGSGTRHVCVRGRSGAVSCWGGGEYGELGDGSTRDRLSLGAVPGITDAVDLMAQGTASCVVTAAGALRCWGDSLGGRLWPAPAGVTTPTTVTGLEAPVRAGSVVVGANFMCQLRADGAAQCWGLNHFGVLGDGTTTDRATPGFVRGIGGR